MTRIIVHNHLTKDGPNNVANAGIQHLAKNRTGGDPACGNRRAHATWGFKEFAKLPESDRCQRCDAIFKEKMKKPFYANMV